MPFPCHSCGAQTPNGNKRKGPCKICYSGEASFCPICAFWELGPPPPALQNELRPRSRKKVGVIIKTCPHAPVVQDAHAANLVQDLRNLCVTVDGQWANHGFDADGNNRGGAYDRTGGYAYNPPARPPEPNQAPGFHCHNSDNADAQLGALAQAMLDDYDDLYARQEPGGGGGVQAKADNDLERTMLVVLASAHERCGYINDRYIHRWDAPTLAAQHFTACFDAYPAIAAGAARALAPTVLGSTILEDLVYGKLSVAYAYWRVRDEVGNPADREDFIRLGAMLLHLWLKNAPVGAIGGGHTFQPRGARGIITPELRAATLTGNGRAFRPEVEKKLAALYACFGGAPPQLPANDQRFADVNIQADPLLNARQRRFLQSMPPMDHAVHVVAITPCEEAVRARIRKMLRRVRGAYHAGAPYPGAGQVTQDLLAATTDPMRDAVINTIVETLHKNLNWIETSSGDRPYTIYEGLGGGARANFGFLSFADGNIHAVPWSHAFPDCMVGIGATFQGQSFLPDTLHPTVVQDGRQNARRWYSEWRWDKDHRVYSGHGFGGDERGKVAQFTFHAGAPYPNHHYGHHTVVWDPAVLRRGVLLVGDKGRPIRSMTLLLHDLLTCPPDVVGDQTPVSHSTFRRLLEHADANHNVDVPNYLPAHGPNPAVTGPAAPAAPAATPKTVLLDRMRGVIVRNGYTDFGDGTDSTQRVIAENYPCESLDPIIECHFFGRATLHDDALLVILREAELDPSPPVGTVIPAIPVWVAAFNGNPSFNVARYRGLPPGAAPPPPWQPRRQNPLPGGPLQNLLAKVPTHS